MLGLGLGLGFNSGKTTMSYTGPKEIQYLFIDGGYFKKTIEKISREFFDCDFVPLDYSVMSKRFTKTFYYDAPVPKKKQSAHEHERQREEQKKFNNMLRLTDGWHIFEGVTKLRKGRAQQKQVDIKIAVDMLTHSQRKNTHKMSFLAGDEDFKPLIEALVNDGMQTELWYEKSSASNELIYSADKRFELEPYVVQSWIKASLKGNYPLPGRSKSGNRHTPEDYVFIQTFFSSSKKIKIDHFTSKKQGNAFIYLNEDDYFMCRHSENLDLLKKITEFAVGPINWEDNNIRKAS